MIVGQQEVLEVLEKVKKPLSRTEIAEILETQATKVSLLLKRMLRFGDIKCIEINRKQALKFYNCKRRMRLYYL